MHAAQPSVKDAVFVVPPDHAPNARQQVTAYCQTLVNAGQARWGEGSEGAAQLHLHTGEVYLFGEFGLTKVV